MDFVIRLFIRFSHNLLISNCCSYGIEESIHETSPRQEVQTQEESSFCSAQEEIVV